MYNNTNLHFGNEVYFTITTLLITLVEDRAVTNYTLSNKLSHFLTIGLST